MDLAILLVMVVIAILLFYRFVERRHKIIAGKIAAGLLALAILIIGLALFFEWQDNLLAEQRLNSVVVTYIPPDVDTADPDPVRTRIVQLLTDDTLTSVRFRLCNNGRDTVTKVSFRPVTLRRERSTEHAISRDISGLRAWVPNDFSSDFILAPDNCRTLTWRRSVVIMDTVVARVQDVRVR